MALTWEQIGKNLREASERGEERARTERIRRISGGRPEPVAKVAEEVFGKETNREDDERE